MCPPGFYPQRVLIISRLSNLVNRFLWLIFIFLRKCKKIIIWKKERRKRDLNPRAGFPTYTLSRGASSASWVFLRIHNFHMIGPATFLSSDALIIILDQLVLVNPFLTTFCDYLRYRLLGAGCEGQTSGYHWKLSPFQLWFIDPIIIS